MAPPVSHITCAACLQTIRTRLFLKCCLCSKHYDIECLNVSEKRFNNTITAEFKSKWQCQECKNKLPKSDNTKTPVRNAEANVTLRNTKLPSSTSSPPPAAALPTDLSYEGDTTAAAASPTSDPLVTELRLFREEMRSAMLELRSAILNATKAVERCNLRIDDLETRVVAVEDRPTIDTNNFQALQQTIAELKLDLNDRDQELLSNDIEVAGLPEENNESCVHLILNIAQKLGVKLEDRDLVNVGRAGPLRRSVNEGDAPPRPRPLVARLARRSLRDQLLAAARVRRDATSAGLGLSSSSQPRPIYINERLTTVNRQLFYKARTESVRANWKYVWTRDGKIYARREHGSPRQRLRSEGDFHKVFGK